MDDIFEVGIGGHFLGRRSTRRHARTEVWRPRAFQRGTFEEFIGRPLAHEAVARAREIIETHEVPPLDEAADRHIDAVIGGWAARAV
jgi:trimethylamine:corrinoid methyltransferase-like protein